MKKEHFRIIIAICAVAFVLVYYLDSKENSQIGRYQLTEISGAGTVILDTTNGEQHFMGVNDANAIWRSFKLGE